MSFANTADPLFMAGAVAVGMFGQPEVAGVLVTAHYLGAVVTGFALRFYKPADPPSPPPAASTQGPMLARAYRALAQARERDGRPFGQVLGDSVRDSVQTLLLIGGYIILFSVLLQILQAAGIAAAATAVVGTALAPLGLDPDTAQGLVAGLFEITLGTQLSAQADAALVDRLVAASTVIAWAGLSVHGQVAAIIQGTGMSLVPYLAARLLHAVAAGAITVWLVTRGLHPALRELGPAWAAAAGEYEAGFAVRLVLATQWLAWTLGCVALVAAATAMVASWSGRRPPRRWIAFYVRRG